MINFSDRLKDLRKAKKLTQKQLSEHVDLSYPTIKSYETGKRKPNSEALCKLEKFFQVSADYLLGNSEINTYFENRAEMKQMLSPLELNLNQLVSTINSLPSNQYIEAVTVLNIMSELLIIFPNNDPNATQSYFESLSGLLFELQRLVYALSEKHSQLEVKRLLNTYSLSIKSCLTDLADIMQIE